MIVVCACGKAQFRILVSVSSILNGGAVNSKPVLKWWPDQMLRQGSCGRPALQMTALAEWLLVVCYAS